jgi:hypothetical protein
MQGNRIWVQSMTEINIIDAKNLTLAEWLNLVYDPPKDKVFLQRTFPSDKHRDEYIATIQSRSHDEVLTLLHSFLIKSTSFDFFDEINFHSLTHAYDSDYERFKKMISHSYY